MLTADDTIAALKLQPHPVEGGYFRDLISRFPAWSELIGRLTPQG